METETEKAKAHSTPNKEYVNAAACTPGAAKQATTTRAVVVVVVVVGGVAAHRHVFVVPPCRAMPFRWRQHTGCVVCGPQRDGVRIIK